jgi:hypothetical protein
MWQCRTLAKVAGGLALIFATLELIDCGGEGSGPCPLEVPEDNSLCNSGGVVVYCHYDCTTGRGADYYALCSGPRWTVTKYAVSCSSDGGDD